MGAHRLVALACLLAACGSDGAPLGAADARGVIDAPLVMPPDAALAFDAPPFDAPRSDAAPGCHFDCFGYAECTAGGQARVVFHAPVPCEQWTGSCPGRTHTCTQGCVAVFQRFFIPGFFSEDQLALWCQETPVAKAGDPCGASAIDCLPVRAVETDAGLVTEHLACGGLYTCEPSPGPSIAGYGAACDTGTATPNVAVETGCEGPGSACLQLADPGAGCLRAGCTVTCLGDHQCPSSSYCDFGVLAATGGGNVPVCRPGPRGSVPASWACRP